MVIDAVFFKGRITQVSPQYGHHTQLTHAQKRRISSIWRQDCCSNRIDRRAYRHGAHIERLLNAGVRDPDRTLSDGSMFRCDSV